MNQQQYFEYFMTKYATMGLSPEMSRVEANCEIMHEYLNKFRAKKGGKKEMPVQIYLRTIEQVGQRANSVQQSLEAAQQQSSNPSIRSPVSETAGEGAGEELAKKKFAAVKLAVQVNYCSSEQKFSRMARETVMELRKVYPQMNIIQVQMHGKTKAVEVILLHEENILLWHTLSDGQLDLKKLLGRIERARGGHSERLV